MSIASLRQEYMRAGLSGSDADRHPMVQSGRCFEVALSAKLHLPKAMTLATADAAGRPSARVVLLKGLEGGGFVFFTNYNSRKARELEARGAACLVFMWSPLERQVRIDGTIERVAAAESDAYYASRPLGARLSAWASPQSQPVASRGVLEAAMEAARRRHGDAPPRPPHWGGYRVLPTEIEFWQGRADRLHDRLLYRRAAARWTVERLSPWPRP